MMTHSIATIVIIDLIATLSSVMAHSITILGKKTLTI